MSPHALAVAALVLVFLIATLRPVNMGLLAFAAAFGVASTVAGATPKEVLSSFPGDLFVTLVGVTFLFAIAQRNGAIDWLVNGLGASVGHHPAMMPWVVFLAAAVLTGFGALGPAAVAIVAPIALRYAEQHRISRLMMGLMVIHGAQAGAFSPTSVYGGITNGVVGSAGESPDPVFLFLASLIFNAAIALLVFFALGGARLLREKAARLETRPPDDGIALSGERNVTLIVLGAVAIATLGFRADIGVASMAAAAFLALATPVSQKGSVDRVAWPTVLLITGVVTYVGLLQRMGTVGAAGEAIGNAGAPMLAALLLCYLGGVVSAFASSTALLGIVVPLALPFLDSSGMSVMGTVAALAVSTTIVDTSPFSTNGALVVANAPEDRRERLFRQLLGYSALITLVGPALAWAVFILPSSS